MMLTKILSKLKPEQYVYLKILKEYVSFIFFSNKEQLRVVCALDSTTYNCGIADKLRGMLSGYAYAKANNIPFIIRHSSPFVIQDYLIPNKYNWIENENTSKIFFWKSKICVSLDNIDDDKLLKKLDTKKPLYLFTNNNLLPLINDHFGTDYKCKDLFNELFCPNALLQKEIMRCKQVLGQYYVSVSYRFVNLLGDDVETSQQKQLSELEKNRLIQQCVLVLQKVHDNHPNSKILLTADSASFIKKVQKIDYLYVIPGKIGHSGMTGSADVMRKTLLDFILISYAQKVYLIKGPGMYNSHFSYFAAHTQGAPFERIDF